MSENFGCVVFCRNTVGTGYTVDEFLPMWRSVGHIGGPHWEFQEKSQCGPHQDFHIGGPLMWATLGASSFRVPNVDHNGMPQFDPPHCVSHWYFLVTTSPMWPTFMLDTVDLLLVVPNTIGLRRQAIYFFLINVCEHTSPSRPFCFTICLCLCCKTSLQGL